MATPNSPAKIIPRIIIHGGAGNITKTTIPQDRYNEYDASLRRILASAASLLNDPCATSLDRATYAVTLLENDPLYNSGHGAVFTLAGTNELECSIMVSNPRLYRKRGVGLMMIKHVKNPIKLAREILMRGEDDDGGGLKDHCQYSGPFVESKARDWGREMCDQSYYFTQQKWDEHIRGLEEDNKRKNELASSSIAAADVDELSDWDKNTYIRLGTCGAVVLDSYGTICVATSTGGLTNKIPGRVGDTPTMGAGYWAEEWLQSKRVSIPSLRQPQMLYHPTSSPLDQLSRGNFAGLIGECIPLMRAEGGGTQSAVDVAQAEKPKSDPHAVGVSSSGNGDTFVRLAAAVTTSSHARFTPTTFTEAVTWMAGPGGELQRSAGDRWGKVHEGTGGMIGIELVGKKSEVVCDYNCGGMFRAWTEEDGRQRCLIFRKEGWESGPEKWEDGMRI